MKFDEPFVRRRNESSQLLVRGESNFMEQQISNRVLKVAKFYQVKIGTDYKLLIYFCELRIEFDLAVNYGKFSSRIGWFYGLSMCVFVCMCGDMSREILSYPER